MISPMAMALKKPISATPRKTGPVMVTGLAEYLPAAVPPLDNPQTDIPRIAKDEVLTRLIEGAVQQIPTNHTIHLGDARQMAVVEPGSVHLVVTSPPYWTLKEYRESEGQMGHIDDYEEFLFRAHFSASSGAISTGALLFGLRPIQVPVSRR